MDARKAGPRSTACSSPGRRAPGPMGSVTSWAPSLSWCGGSTRGCSSSSCGRSKKGPAGSPCGGGSSVQPALSPRAPGRLGGGRGRGRGSRPRGGLRRVGRRPALRAWREGEAAPPVAGFGGWRGPALRAGTRRSQAALGLTIPRGPVVIYSGLRARQSGAAGRGCGATPGHGWCSASTGAAPSPRRQTPSRGRPAKWHVGGRRPSSRGRCRFLTRVGRRAQRGLGGTTQRARDEGWCGTPLVRDARGPAPVMRPLARAAAEARRRPLPAPAVRPRPAPLGQTSAPLRREVQGGSRARPPRCSAPRRRACRPPRQHHQRAVQPEHAQPTSAGPSRSGRPA